MILKDRLPLDLSEFTQEDLDASVFMTIDMQEEYAKKTKRGNAGTERAAKKIAKRSVAFNRRGLDIAHILWDDNRFCTEHLLRVPKMSKIYRIKPKRDKGDLIYKNRDSAFKAEFNEHSIHDYLLRKPKKKLFLSGFNLNACVMRTAISAVENYDVILVSDLVANGQGRFPWTITDEENFEQVLECIEYGLYSTDNFMQPFDRHFFLNVDDPLVQWMTKDKSVDQLEEEFNNEYYKMNGTKSNSVHYVTSDMLLTRLKQLSSQKRRAKKQALVT